MQNFEKAIKKDQAYATRMARRIKRWAKPHNTLIVILLAIAILLLIDFSPFGGNMRFYAKWIECGQKPLVAVGTGFMGGNALHYESTETIELLRGHRTYFCTPLEAEKAGYSANPNYYEFPHLDKFRNNTPE